MHLTHHKDIPQADLLDLYSSVEWSAYTKDPEKLTQAISNSSFVVSAWENDTLVGLARCLSDDHTIMYLQDLLVRPTHQRKGIGTILVKECLKRYSHVRQTVLLTDDSSAQAEFYKSLGLENIRDWRGGSLNAFIRFISQVAKPTFQVRRPKCD